MYGEIDQAAQFCEDKDTDKLASLVPKIVDVNAVVFIFEFRINGTIMDK